MRYLLERFQEPSTWRGVVMFVTGTLGVSMPPEAVAQIVTMGMGLVGLIGMVTKDSQAKD